MEPDAFRLQSAIVTHTRPDWDAITATWLLKRFSWFRDAIIEFVPAGQGTSDVIIHRGGYSYIAVVDTGRVFDPTIFRFDHHQFPGQQCHDTCAAMQVYQFCQKLVKGDIGYLHPLIQLVWLRDIGKRDEWSKISTQLGIHALLNERRYRGDSDHALMVWGFEILDMLASSLKRKREDRVSLHDHIVYCDERVIGILNGSRTTTDAAFSMIEPMRKIVVFANKTRPQTTITVGIQRAPESGLHCGKLVQAVIDREEVGTDSILGMELDSWFRHESGWFAGRGTDTSPSVIPLRVKIELICHIMSEVLQNADERSLSI